MDFLELAKKRYSVRAYKPDIKPRVIRGDKRVMLSHIPTITPGVTKE